MKMKYYIYTAALGLLALSCVRFEEEAVQEQQQTVPMRLTALMDSEEAITKTYLDGKPVVSVRNTYWLPDDAIGVTGNRNVAKFENICEDTTSVAVFDGQYESLETYYAFYPYSEDASYSSSDTTLTLTIPQVQKYQENTFATDVVPMVAQFNIGDSLYFKNICGGFVAKITGTAKITNLHLTMLNASGDDAKVAGKFKVDLKSDIYQMTYTEQSTMSISIDCGEGVQLDPTTPTAFHFILPPDVYKGVKLVITSSEGERMIKSSSSDINIKRSNITYTPAFKYEDNVVPVDLSQQGHSNCYIVPELGIYSFDATVIGNGAFGMIDNAGFHTDDYHIKPESVEVLWQDRENVIYDVTLKEGRVHFLSDGVEGNALVAVKDALGNILWSWHIWATDYPREQVYHNDVGAMMDRNLGAISAVPGDVGALGLLYQWGRKDPFLGSASINKNSDIISTITWPSGVSSSQSAGTIKFVVQNPTTYVYGTSATASDWHYSTRNDMLWQSRKTIYDPCPPGWRVPDGRDAGIWRTDDFSDIVFDATNRGVSFSSSAAPFIWYPAAGLRSRDNGSLGVVGSGGHYWSVATNGYYGCYMSVGSSGLNPFANDSRAYGFSVRCMQDAHINSVLVILKGVSDLTSASAYALAEVVVQGNIQVEKSGYVIGTDPNPTIDNSRVVYSEVNMGDISMTINDLSPINKYYIKAFAMTTDNTIVYSPEVVPFITPNDLGLFDLSAKESANCYIVYPVQSTYCFDLVKGNSGESVGIATSAEILWETYGTVDEVIQGSVVKSASIKGDQVVFEIPDNAVPGNALIAVKDSEGTILWSWHIWVVDFDPELNGQLYPGGAILMDRNLGALTAVINDSRTNGLLYQWGRKDPFVGYASSKESVLATVCPIDAMSSNNLGMTDYRYSISHPTEAIIGTVEWCDGTRWDVRKTIYDPCPSGWRVPDGGPGVWDGVAEDIIVHYEEGVTLNSTIPAAYYPTSGYFDSNGNAEHNGFYGWIWSCSLSNNNEFSAPYAFLVSSFSNGSVQLGRVAGRGHRSSIRCMKIDNSGETGNGDDYIVDDEYEW